jgi:hypothetical protein
MRIAYLLMIHNNFAQVKWIINAIHTPDDYFIIHIDKNSTQNFRQQVNRYVGNLDNVKYLTPYRMTRFGWSIVETELCAIRELASSKHEWKYVINVSGQDYPIKSMGAIKSKLIKEWPRNFIEVIPLVKIAEQDPHDPHLTRRLAFEMFGRVVTTRIRPPFSKMVDVDYKGSAWFMLTRDFCEWIMSNQITRKIARRVRYTWNPDELFFQALLMNSPYRNSLAEHYGREIIWPGGTASPKTLCMEDYERLSASPALFARKFDESVDRQVLVSLARDHGYQVPAR